MHETRLSYQRSRLACTKLQFSQAWDSQDFASWMNKCRSGPPAWPELAQRPPTSSDSACTRQTYLKKNIVSRIQNCKLRKPRFQSSPLVRTKGVSRARDTNKSGLADLGVDPDFRNLDFTQRFPTIF